MAIVQISRITNRKGLTENLPQLAGAELGWCTDSRRLFIGNGTLQDGAPIIGNTEIITEFSDITVLSDYTYEDIAVGYAAQTGPTTSDPVVRTVQAKLDDFASVRDFGATGDGSTDDTVAINRALNQLYCQDNNPLTRRTLYFPAGNYRVTETIIIPTYAKLMGEGADCTFIELDTASDISTLNAYVARYGDSLQQTGVNIGNNGATAPQNIEISSMTFKSLEVTDIFLVEDATQCWFDSVNFVGPLTQANIIADTSTDDIAGVRFSSTTSIICNNITFDKCGFSNTTYAIATTEAFQSVTMSNSRLTTLYQGVFLDGGAPNGFRAVQNVFDDVYAEALNLQDTNLNVSAYNLFLNVGNSIGAGSPTEPVITFGNDNNVSIGDMFQRSDADALTEPRIAITGSTATSGGTGIQLGRYARETGRTATIDNNQTGAETVISVASNDIKAFKVEYTITRATSYRSGVMIVVNDTADAVYTDEFTENSSTGVTLSATKSGGTLLVQYTSTNTGNAGSLTYSVTHLA
jgi:hypothetical protein